MNANDVSVSERQLEWIERYFFLKYDKTYAEVEQDGLPREDELRAFKEAMEVITELRKELFDDRNSKIEKTASEVESALIEENLETI